MNANELADLLETGGEKSLDEVATMLRQQQAEIESLKAIVARLTIEGGKEIKPAKYSAGWWKEVEEFNKQLREQEK